MARTRFKGPDRMSKRGQHACRAEDGVGGRREGRRDPGFMFPSQASVWSGGEGTSMRASGPLYITIQRTILSVIVAFPAQKNYQASKQAQSKHINDNHILMNHSGLHSYDIIGTCIIELLQISPRIFHVMFIGEISLTLVIIFQFPQWRIREVYQCNKVGLIWIEYFWYYFFLWLSVWNLSDGCGLYLL